MKIAIGEKIHYYDLCPECGAKREGDSEKCPNCGKSLIRNVEKNEGAAEEEETSLYKVREQKTASENFKSLKGKNKFRYFMDYYFGKVVIIVIILSLLGGLLYTTFKPRQEPVFYIASVVNPIIGDGSLDKFKEDLAAMFVKDEAHENIMFDSSYSSLVSDYNSMVGYTMHVSAGEVDIVILTKDELRWQVNNQAVSTVDSVISKEILDRIDDSCKYKLTPAYTQEDGSAEYGEEAVYGLVLSDFLKKINGFEVGDKYVVAFIGNAPHKDKFDRVVKYFFDLS